MSDGREIVCNRLVFVDSEFDAKKGQGEPPGPPVCYLRDRDRSTRPRDRAPARGALSGAAAVGAWRSVPHGRLCTLGRGGKLLHMCWPFPLPAIDLYAEYMVLHNTEMCARRGQQTAGTEPDRGLPALRRRRNGQGPQGGHARARLHQDRPHAGRDRPAAGLLHRGLPDGDAAVQGDAAAHRSAARTDTRRVHDGDRADALARHPDRHADLSPSRATRARWSWRGCARS